MDYSKLLEIFSDKLIEANEIYINEKLSQLGFDKTRRGKVISVSGTNCVVEIDGEEFNCKLRRGIYVEPNDIVFVKFPQDSNVDKYVDAILGGNETPTFTHNQLSPEKEWNVVHNLNRFPTVTVVDSGGSVVLGDVQYIDENQIKIVFTTSFSGKAYLN